MGARGHIAKPAAEITLLVPGLAGPPDPAGHDPAQAARLLLGELALPAFARLAARGQALASPCAASTLDGMLCEAFGLARPEHADWPVAALTRQGFERDAGDGLWLRADPVHLRADMGRLVLFAPSSLALTLDEAARITGWLNAHEFAPGLELQPASATCWHLRVDRLPRMRCTAPSLAHGRDADASLPSGPDASRWHAHMNALQMLLHLCPVNEERARRGLSAVNSVWFWGAGALPHEVPACFEAVHAGHELARGLAACAGVPVREPPPDADALLAACDSGRHLLVLDALQPLAAGADLAQWVSTLASLEHAWFAPLAKALARGSLARLDVHAGSGAGYGVTRRALRRWWRRVPDAASALGALRNAVRDASQQDAAR